MIFNTIEKIGAGEWQEYVLTGSGHVHDIVVRAEPGSVMSAFDRSTVQFTVRVDAYQLLERYADRDEAFNAGYFALEYLG
jgi:hypothetical protein